MSDEPRLHDENLVRLIDREYRPDPLSRTEVGVMLTRIRACSAPRPRGTWPAWGALAAVGLAFVLWFVQPAERGTETVDALLLPAEAIEVEPDRRTDGLMPQDYAAIEAFFLDR